MAVQREEGESIAELFRHAAEEHQQQAEKNESGEDSE